MHTTTLRKVGGSMMLSVPPALLDLLRLRPGAKLGITVEGGQLVVKPFERPRYSLAELLAQCDPKAAGGKQENEWFRDQAAGGELL